MLALWEWLNWTIHALCALLNPDWGWQPQMAMLEINFWAWTSAGLVGLKFAGPSAKLLITLIFFQFFLDVCHLCLQVNTWNCNQKTQPWYLFTRTWLPKQVSHSMHFAGLMCFQAVCLEMICSNPCLLVLACFLVEAGVQMLC